MYLFLYISSVFTLFCLFQNLFFVVVISLLYIQIGDSLPNIKLYEDSPDNSISASELYKGKRGVLFAVVGAFTPGCTNVSIRVR